MSKMILINLIADFVDLRGCPGWFRM